MPSRSRSASILFTLGLTVTASCATGSGTKEPAPQDLAAGSAAAPARGVIGDTVRMVVNHVRPEKREQFERFMREVLHPTMERAAPGDRETADHMRRARMLRAVKPDTDGTYAYIFLVDPAGSSVPYSFARLIQRTYPPEQAAEQMRMYTASLARPSESSTLVNTAW